MAKRLPIKSWLRKQPFTRKNSKYSWTRLKKWTNYLRPPFRRLPALVKYFQNVGNVEDTCISWLCVRSVCIVAIVTKHMHYHQLEALSFSKNSNVQSTILNWFCSQRAAKARAILFVLPVTMNLHFRISNLEWGVIIVHMKLAYIRKPITGLQTVLLRIVRDSWSWMRLLLLDGR